MSSSLMNRLVSLSLLVFVLFANVCNADEVEVTMSDDSYVAVPLNFGFPLYGQVFTHSIMYDNGVVGLYDPTAGTGCNPANMYCAPINWNPQGAWAALNAGQLNAQSFSYLVAPFWTDIAPVEGTTVYTIDSGADYQRYKWHNMVEFYSIYGNTEQQAGGARYSSFELELLESGQIYSTYGDVDINTSSVWTGITGDVSAGEINEYRPLIEYGTQVTTGVNIEDWEVSSNGTMTTTTAADPCVADPLSSSTCSGYEAAFLAQQCAVDSLYDTACDGYGQAYVDDQCDVDPLFSPSCAGYSNALAMNEEPDDFDFQDDFNTGGIDDQCANDPNCPNEFNDFDNPSNDGFDNPEDGFQDDPFYEPNPPPEEYFDPEMDFNSYGGTGTNGNEEEFYPGDIGLPNMQDGGPNEDFGGDDGQPAFDDPLPQEQFYTEQPFQKSDSISEDGEISTEQVAKEAAKVEKEPMMEEFFEDEEILLDDMEITDILEEDFLDEDFLDEEPLLKEKLLDEPGEPEFQEEEELALEEEEREEARPEGPRRNNKAISIAVRESRKLVRNAETASVSSSGSSGNSSNSGNSGSSGGANSGNNGSSSGNYGNSGSSGGGFTGGSSFDGGASSFDGSFSAEQQFFSSDLSLSAALTGQTGLELENVSNNEQFTQNVQDMQQNIALGDSAPIGFSISEPTIEQNVEVEVSKAPSLADRIAETARVQNIENSNAAASGQILALGALASGANLEAYYTTLDYNSVVYQNEQVYRDAQLSDNTVTHYNLFSKSHGKIQAMIRSQYER